VRVVLLFYLMPLWAVLLARLLLGERIGGRAAARIALALTGAAVVLWPGSSPLAARPGLADALALLGGLSFALNNVMLRREARRSEGARALAMFVGGAAVAAALAVALGPALGVPLPPAPAAGWLLGVAALAAWFLASNLALQYGAARLPAHTTAVVMITEVFFASASALALGTGSLQVHTAVGGALILGAAALATWQRG
jgi:drug/metabolite transporter (DMT)-like permease